MFVLALLGFIVSGGVALYSGAAVWYTAHQMPRNRFHQEELSRQQMVWTISLVIAVLNFGFCGESLFL